MGLTKRIPSPFLAAASPGYEKAGYDCVPSLNASLTAANAGGQTVSFAGVSVSGNDSSWGAAIAAAAAADAVVLCLGTDQTIAGEGTDRTSEEAAEGPARDSPASPLPAPTCSRLSPCCCRHRAPRHPGGRAGGLTH